MRPVPATADLWTEAKAALAVLLLYGFCLINLEPIPEGAETFVLTIGALAIWRYSWQAVHIVRGTVYQKKVFPRLRASVEEDPIGCKPSQIYVLITSYRIDHETTFAVYDGLISNAAAYGVPTIIVASITDETDTDVLSHVLAHNKHPPNVQIRCIFQKGDGKRSAMADALRSIARDMPGPDSLLVMMDGDILLPEGTFDKSMGFFALNPNLGAATTDNRGIVAGNGWTKEWYDLRYAQRQIMMSSVSLSKRLLVLTGRYSVFRGDLVNYREFIEMVEKDQLQHWRFGRFKFLSGDDKSSWFWLLRNRYEMMYLPDVVTFGFEALPDDRAWFKSTLGLMRRWYGNMLRSNGRAVALGPRRMGFFTWWCLVDQRLSMWTTLVGPTMAVMLAATNGMTFIFSYLSWIISVRIVACLILSVQRRRFSFTWPILLYYGQMFGALLKTYVAFRINQQKWTRQNISAGEPVEFWRRSGQRFVSHCLHAGQLAVFIYILGIHANAISPPSSTTFYLLLVPPETASVSPFAVGAGPTK